MDKKPAAPRAAQSERSPIAGELFLRALADHGVDYFFANPGTDFPPIIEAFTRAKRSNAKVPQPVLAPHENLAVAMAHGAYLMNGRAQAVMVHVNVGTANAINNIINMNRDRVPLILAAGRTPITEKGAFGSRTRQIHWAQEMFDQAGMVREAVKWDYELRVPQQVGDVVSRAHEMTMASPRGPVYLILPREPLAAPVDDAVPVRPRPVAPPAYPDPAAIETLAEWIAAAKHPLIITSYLDAGAATALAKLTERFAIPVVMSNGRTVCLPSSHAMNFGSDGSAMLDEADLILVLESDAPWYPSLQEPSPQCRIVHLGEDPTYQRYPMRSFPSDLAIAANAAVALGALDAALETRMAKSKTAIEARRADLTERNGKRRERLAKESANGKTISPTFLSRTIGEAFGEDDVIFNEYPLQLDHCRREKPGTYFALSPAGGLGWAVAAALGAKLAAPDKMIVATTGDGAYLFGNPTVCHWTSAYHKLPTLTIIFNNSRYGAVRKATLSMFKDGAAGEDDGNFLADLNPSPPYDEFVRAQGGHAERIENPADLRDALLRARDVVMKEKRQALLNVICPY